MTHPIIYDALRTPRGRGRKNGALHGTRPVELVTNVIHALRKRHPGLDEDRLSDIILGVVWPVGDQGGDIALTAALVSGLPHTVGGVQINRFCASGLEAINLAAQKVRSGWDELVLAGGVESMSRVPMGSDGRAWANDPTINYDTYFVPQGVSADLIATIEGFSRSRLDEYAVRSQELAAAAWRNGWFGDSVIPVTDRNGLVVLDHDEHMRPDSTVQSLGELPPSFAVTGEQDGFDAQDSTSTKATPASGCGPA